MTIPNHFASSHVYNGTAVVSLGEDALSPGEIDAIEEIVLLNYRIRLEARSIVTSPWRRIDILRRPQVRGGSFQAEGSLIEQPFRINYRHVKAPRTLTLYAGSSSSYTRDENAHYAEQWMVLRVIVMKTGARAAKGVNKDDQAVASY